VATTSTRSSNPVLIESPLNWPSRLLKNCFSEGVILSEAKDLLSARAESKADPKRKIGATSG
jgi:hypothetical protein